jgi:hypothetical protein
MSYNLWALVACILLLSLLITTAFLPSCFQGLTYWIRNDVVQSISLSEDRSNDVFKNMEKKSPADEEEIEYMKAYFTAEQSIPSERQCVSRVFFFFFIVALLCFALVVYGGPVAKRIYI